MKFNPLIPELDASNFSQSLSFYTDILGFHIEYQRPERQFAFLSYQGSQIMLEQSNDNWKTGERAYPFGRGINFQITVDNLDTIIASLKTHNYPLFVEPADHWYRKDSTLLGLREFLVMDPDGYLLRFSQAIGSKAYEE